MSKVPKKGSLWYFCNILRENCCNCLMQNIQIFYGSPVMFVVTFFFFELIEYHMIKNLSVWPLTFMGYPNFLWGITCNFIIKPEYNFFKAQTDCSLETMLCRKKVNFRSGIRQIFFWKKSEQQEFAWLVKQFGATILWQISNLGMHKFIRIQQNLSSF